MKEGEFRSRRVSSHRILKANLLRGSAPQVLLRRAAPLLLHLLCTFWTEVPDFRTRRFAFQFPSKKPSDPHLPGFLKISELFRGS